MSVDTIREIFIRWEIWKFFISSYLNPVKNFVIWRNVKKVYEAAYLISLNHLKVAISGNFGKTVPFINYTLSRETTYFFRRTHTIEEASNKPAYYISPITFPHTYTYTWEYRDTHTKVLSTDRAALNLIIWADGHPLWTFTLSRPTSGYMGIE